ncbi:hypothetical protein [Pseudomonas cerasi]|uniref:hypothetical protein n=1 Tax=Pseudomonas cerasi TaxID=1583341 RepID=UPI0012FF8086|nr:hypothetical protein [Pseudomonas cerasi]
MDSDDREHWKTLVPAELRKMAKERAAAESLLKKSGISIDKNYQEPTISILEAEH